MQGHAEIVRELPYNHTSKWENLQSVAPTWDCNFFVYWLFIASTFDRITDCFEDMKLRRKYITQAKADRTLQKCLAIVLILKNKLKSSRIHHYSINKVCQTVGISHKTAERYLPRMEEYRLIHFEGTSENKVLIVNSVSSHTSNRNICADEMDLSSFFSAYRSVQSFIFMHIQHNKDFMRHLLQARHNPDSPEQFRKVKKQVRNLVRQGRLCSVDAEYEEYGLSLKKIAETVGCCISTIQRVIDFALFNQWVEKERHFEWYPAPGINHMQIDGFTFSTENALCIVHPNTYSLSPSISQALSYGMVCI